MFRLDGLAGPKLTAMNADRHRPGGVGEDKKAEAEPHEPAVGSVARLAHDASAGAVCASLRRPDQGRDILQMPRDAQRPMPHARRPEHRPDLVGGLARLVQARMLHGGYGAEARQFRELVWEMREDARRLRAERF